MPSKSRAQQVEHAAFIDELQKIALMTRMQMGSSGMLNPQGGPVNVAAIPGNRFSSPEWQAGLAKKPPVAAPMQMPASAIRKPIVSTAARPVSSAARPAAAAAPSLLSRLGRVASKVVARA